MEPDEAFDPGQVVSGKFRVDRVIGEGGMGIVVEAMHLGLDERVALKFVRRDVRDRPEILERFSQEARAAVKLKSEHVARVIDVGTERGIPYLVMEYLDGKNLEEILRQRQRLEISEAVDLIIQACEAISEAHARGIVHRDIKPENLFVTQREGGWRALKVLDFGISKAALTGKVSNVDLQSGQTTAMMGSPYYMSPEQVRSAKDVDWRSDIWALGAVLFELLTGLTAFASTEFTPLVAEILEKPHRSLRAVLPDAPPELEEIIDQCMHKEPHRRFRSAAELAIALLPFTHSKRARVVAASAANMTRESGIDPHLALPSSLPPPSMSSMPLRTTPGLRAAPLPVIEPTPQPARVERPSSKTPVATASPVPVVPAEAGWSMQRRLLVSLGAGLAAAAVAAAILSLRPAHQDQAVAKDPPKTAATNASTAGAGAGTTGAAGTATAAAAAATTAQATAEPATTTTEPSSEPKVAAGAASPSNSPAALPSSAGGSAYSNAGGAPHPARPGTANPLPKRAPSMGQQPSAQPKDLDIRLER